MKVLKLIGGLIAGILAGLLIAAIILMMFTDITASEFIANMRSASAAKAALAAFMGVVAFVVSLAILIPAHEAGHLVCGLLSGYRFVSFRIFNFTFIKERGKLRVKKYSVAGTGGQCLLSPPDLPLEKIPTGWYNAGGVLANLLLLLVALPFFCLDLSPLAREVLAIFCITDGFLILTNGIPMKLGGISNDAYNMLFLNRNLMSKRALVLQLRTNALIQDGLRPSCMPDAWFEWTTDINFRNPLEVSIPLMYASRLIDELKWDEACERFTELYSHRGDIMQLYVNEIACELAFCMMITGRREEAAALLDDKLLRYITDYSKVMSSKQRILCARALFLENDRPKAEAILHALEADARNYLLRGEVESDLAIMNSFMQNEDGDKSI